MILWDDDPARAPEAAAFYRECFLELVNESEDLRAQHPTMIDSADVLADLAGIALVAANQELNPHEVPDVPWCGCQMCQKWLFEMRWARTHPGYSGG